MCTPIRFHIFKGGFKASETLLGIETTCEFCDHSLPLSFKASETLLGIETPRLMLALEALPASKPLKPF